LNTTVPGNLETFEPYTITNFTLGLFDFIKNTKVSLVCNNILDKAYYSPGPILANGINNPSTILQMGRNYMIRLNYEF
jgi:outer membrane receptor protein involved in Fe transport